MEDVRTPLWFRITILSGVLLAVLVLIQTAGGYLYLSSTLVQQEGQRIGQRTMRALQTAIRFSGTRTAVELEPVLDDLQLESPESIAWLAIRDPEGLLLAASNGRPPNGIVKLTSSSSIDPQDAGLQPVVNPPCWASKTAVSFNLTIPFELLGRAPEHRPPLRRHFQRLGADCLRDAGGVDRHVS